MATQKLSGACLFVIFLCHLEWSLEALERRCAAYSLTVKSPAACQEAELGGGGGGQPHSSSTIPLLCTGSQHQNVQFLTPYLLTHKRKPTKVGTLKPDFYPIFQLSLRLPSQVEGHTLHKGTSLESSSTRAL